MPTKSNVFILLLAVLHLSALSSHAQTPPFASVQRVEIDGSGCEAGSANALITNDLNYLSVLYDRFAVEIGKGTANPGAKSAEKKCTVNVIVNVPAGWNFTFESIDYRGYVQLPNKMAFAYQLISAEIGGGRGIGFDQNIIRGSKNENFVTTVRNKSSAALSNLSCSNQNQDVSIKIKSVIGVRNALTELTKPALRLVVDSTDAAFRQNLRLAWKPCR